MIGVCCFTLFFVVSLMFFIYLLYKKFYKDDKKRINILNSSIEEIEKYNLEEL